MWNNNNDNLCLRLSVLSFLQYGIWGCYLISLGLFLGVEQLGQYIGWFYSIQGIVSLLLPPLMGVVADRWIPAQRLLSLCHLFSAVGMGGCFIYGISSSGHIDISILIILYTISVAFYMPTIALYNAVTLSALKNVGYDAVKVFPKIRPWGTVGFICAMWLVDLTGFKSTASQFGLSGALGVLLSLYALSLPPCPVSASKGHKTLRQAMGVDALVLFRQRKMALFFVFCVLLGVCLQIANGYASPYLEAWGSVSEYADSFMVRHSVILTSMSQMSETFCFLLIPFFMRRFGIKIVMLIALVAWSLRFLFFAVGNPADGFYFIILSMIIYGVAFDFFNISASLFVDAETTPDTRSSAQGLLMMMSNGFGSTIGMLAVQSVVNHYVPQIRSVEGWDICWYIFAAYAFVVALLFMTVFPATRKKS